MSTYIYLVCPSHPEPVEAEEESGQHLYDLPTVRFNWLRRDHWLSYIDRFPGTLGREFDHLSYFERNTWRFLLDHRDCGIPCIVDEYGGRYSIVAHSIAELLTQEPNWTEVAS